jgi:hypothetical protein
MLLSLWGHRYLIERGYIDRRETASLLARLGPAPPLLRPVYRTADRVSPTEH